jgi:hypothetical protein
MKPNAVADNHDHTLLGLLLPRVNDSEITPRFLSQFEEKESDRAAHSLRAIEAHLPFSVEPTLQVLPCLFLTHA